MFFQNQTNTGFRIGLILMLILGIFGVLPARASAETSAAPIAEGNLIDSGSALGKDCSPNGGWMWTNGPLETEVAVQVQEKLSHQGIEANIEARSYGETDSCGTYSHRGIDFTVTLVDSPSNNQLSQQTLADKIFPVLVEFGKPELGNVKVFSPQGDLLPINKSPMFFNDGFPNTESLSAGLLPADAITKNVYVIVYDPLLSNGQKLSQYMHWNDHSVITQQTVDFFKQATNDRMNYVITNTTIVTSGWPELVDGFTYTEPQYLAVMANSSLHHVPTEVDYNKIVNSPQFDICGKLNRGEIDEVWIYNGPWFGFYESTLVGPGAYAFNSPPVGGAHNCNKLLPIMGPSPERIVDEAVHNFTHRAEATMAKVYGSWQENNTSHNWNKFALVKAQSPNYSYSGCGSSHYPPNGTSDYNYNNASSVLSNCNDFVNYPNLSDPLVVSQPVTCSTWGCTQLGYFNYWFGHFPAFLGCGPDNVANDWWKYLSSPAYALYPSNACQSNMHWISGNVGAGGVTLNYTDGTSKTVASDASGNYSLLVSNHWSGAVTPSKANIIFTPTSKNYVDVQADFYSQDYTAQRMPYYVNIAAGNNSNSCTSVVSPCRDIQETINKASAGDVIKVAGGTYVFSVNGSPNVVIIDKDITLSGGWNSDFTLQNGASIIDGANVNNGILAISGTVVVESFIVQNSISSNSGAIYIVNGNFTLKKSTLRNNIANSNGAGIFLDNGTLTVINSTIRGNTAGGSGGGIYASNNSGASVSIQNSTIVYNQASTGGGISRPNGTYNITNTIIANNAATFSPDCNGTIAIANFNIIENTAGCSVTGGGNNLNVDPQIDSNLTGVMPVHALLTGSPAINAGTNTGCPFTDQRGVARPQGVSCDIGAYEFQVATTTLMVSPATGTYGNAVNLTATLQSSGVGLSGKPINFTLNGTSVGSAVTNTSGVATLSNTSLVGINAETYADGVGASFASEGMFNASNGSATLTVNKRSITVTAVTGTKQYDGTVSSSGVPTITLGTLASGDTATWTQSFSNKNVGVGKTMIPTGSVSDGNSGNNYTVTFVNNITGVITARAITVTAVTSTKQYDGTVSSSGVPTITAGTLVLGDTATWTQSFSNKNVGTGKTIIPAGSVSDGNSGNNYTVTFVNNITGVIAARAITVTAVTSTKQYDGTVSSSGVPTITSGTLVSGDTATWIQSFSNKNVGMGKTMIPTGSVSDGNSGNNYAVTFANNITGVITARAITVTAVTGTKQYDGTVSSMGVPTITSGTLASGDTATWTQSFSNKNVGVGKTMIPAGSVSDGNSGNNYTVTFVNNITGVITVRAITVTAVTSTKQYDGTVSSSGVPTITSGTLASGDTAAWTQSFSSKNAGTGKTIIPAGSVSDGNSGNNYTVTFVNNITGMISARAITVTAVTSTKQYDGTVSSSGVPTITSGTLASGDTATWTQSFSNKNAGTGKTIIPAGSVSDGNSGNNYAVTFVNNTTSAITAHAITVTAVSDIKSYDGTTASIGDPTITSGNLAVGDTAIWTQSFSNKNVGTGKTIIPAGSVSDGNNGNNYTVTFVNDFTGVITKTPLIVTADNLSKLVDDPDPVFTFTYLGFLEMDSTIDVDTHPTCNVTISHTNVGTYPIVCSGGLDNNYTLTYVNGTLTVLTGYSISGTAGVAGATLSYTDGTPKTVIADGSGNYSITVPYGWSGTVIPSLNADAFCPSSQTYTNLTTSKTLQNYAHDDCRTFDSISKWTSAFDLSHGWTVKDYVRTVGDVNNDGRADLIGFGQDGVYVALSNGTSFDPISKWTSAFDLSHGWTVASYVRTVGDVNADGRADLIGFGQDGVYVALSNGTSFDAISKWTSSFDLSHGWTVASYVRTVGDVNNDGRADLVGFGQDGVYVALSNGTSFGAISKWTSAFDLSHGWTVKDYVRTVGDVNNDGRVDLIGFGQDGVYIALSMGTTFSLPSRRTTSFDLSHGWTVASYVRTVGDVSGDGKADLVGFGLDGVYVVK